MELCNHCQDAGTVFNDKKANKELKRYLKKGPPRSTRLLIESLREENMQGKSLLDIGGGIGAIQHELSEDGLLSIYHVEASQAYIKVSEAEAERRGYSDRLHSWHGDFVQLAPQLPETDIITADRALCCYPYMEKFVKTCALKSRRYCALVYPVESYFIAAGIVLANLYFKLSGNDFRLYLHSRNAINEIFKAEGFELHYTAKTLMWHVDIYASV